MTFLAIAARPMAPDFAPGILVMIAINALENAREGHLAAGYTRLLSGLRRLASNWR